MGAILSGLIEKRLRRKGYVHVEEQIVERYMYKEADYRPGHYLSKPKLDPDGDTEYIRKEKVQVVDRMSEEDAMKVLLIEQQKTIDAMQDRLGKIEKNSADIRELLEYSESHQSTIKGIMIFYLALSLISLILSVLGMCAVS